MEFAPYREDVYRWALRVVRSPHDAQDIAQDVFLRWTRQCAVEVPAQARAWLRRVTLHRALDTCRARSRDAALARKLPAPEPALPGLPLEHAELRADVARALAELSEMQRAVIAAKVFDDLSFSALADQLGIAPSTAKTHWLRGLVALKGRLERWG